MAARPRTLPAAAAPVLVGTALAGFAHVFHPLRFVAALLGAIFIQVGTNLSNDYSDARRGADTEDRLGPVRVTAGGLVPPRQVLIATYVTLRHRRAGRRLPDRRRRLAAAAGRRGVDPGRRRLHRRPAALRLRGAGRGVRVPVLRDRRRGRLVLRPGQQLHWEAFALAVPVGLLAAAILVVNNVRDIDTDRRAGKRTLAVRLGRERTRTLFAVVVYLAYVLTPVTWVFGPDHGVGAAAVADAAAGRARGADGAQPHRRAVAQRGAGPERDAPAGVLHAALGRAAAQPVTGP